VLVNTDQRSEALRACPFCGERIEPFQGPNNHTMGTCHECGYCFVVPAKARDKARPKRADANKEAG
jgi:hypothetical protein